MASVTIAIPTYNRAGTLRRALDSALAQTHEDLVVLVADNASTDDTAEIGRHYAATDPRIRYVRRSVNQGPTANFNALFRACSTEFTQMLADDDWLDRDYVATCLAELRTLPQHALVCGRAVYHRDGHVIGHGVQVQLEQDDPAERLAGYLRTVQDNGTFYGLVRTEILHRVGSMPNVLGNDWFHVAGIAYCGKVRTLDTTHVRREAGGTSETIGDILQTFGGATGLDRWAPYIAIARGAYRHIASEGAAYADRAPAERRRLALRAAPLAIRWRYTLWHPIRPAALRLRRRARGRRVVDALLRAAGGAPPA